MLHVNRMLCTNKISKLTSKSPPSVCATKIWYGQLSQPSCHETTQHQHSCCNRERNLHDNLQAASSAFARWPVPDCTSCALRLCLPLRARYVDSWCNIGSCSSCTCCIHLLYAVSILSSTFASAPLRPHEHIVQLRFLILPPSVPLLAKQWYHVLVAGPSHRWTNKAKHPNLP